MRKQIWILQGSILSLLLLAALSACSPTKTDTITSTITPTASASLIDPNLEPKPSLQTTATNTQTVQETQAIPPNNATNTPTSPPVQNQNASQMSAEENQLAQQLLAQINSDRVNNNLPALAWNAQLTQSAIKHSQLMADGCGLSHQCSKEAGLGDRIGAEGLKWSSVGENIAYTYGSSSKWQGIYDIHMSMLNETPPDDGHRKNYLSTSFHRLGISILIDNSGKIWLTEDFAN